MSVELSIALDRREPGSIATKLVLALRRAIESGELRPADRLPPTRELAQRLGVSRGTVVAAYEQLVAEGYFSAGQGRGTRVNPDLARLHGRALHPASGAQDHARQRRPSAHESPAPPLTGLVARSAWRSAWRRAASSPRLGQEVPVAGDEGLLAEIAEHLRAMRGTVREPGDLLVTGGAREGLGLILTALGTTRGTQLIVGVEEGAPHSLQGVALRHGARIVTLPADREGLDTSRLPDSQLDAVIVTPTAQYPDGALLPLDRRQGLLSWATHNGVTVIEDDFDSELRYLRAPLPTLSALDDPRDGVVATLGSFSATLSLSLAAGFLILPKRLYQLVYAVRHDLGCPVSPVLQFALAELLRDGELRREVARLRRARARERIRDTAI